MQFTTFSFAVFFPVVVLLFYLIPKKARRLWLLAASYYFYMGWNVKYALLILTSTVITYLCAIMLDKFETSGLAKRRCILWVSIVLNLLILIFFKYFYFLHDTADMLLSVFGYGLADSKLDIVLPVGISFYTFQALGYTIDVYRKDVKAEKNFINYALFVSFFPQLVAGPIERSGHLLGQIQELMQKGKKQWNFDNVTRGLLMMLWGYFLKLVIADRAGIVADHVFEYYYMSQGIVLWFGAMMFLIQLYCDFASYSNIAIGASLILGVELTPNFAAPFLSRSISEFWRRWHISLSSWLRDYIYIPLGGSRCSKLKKYRNTLITFFVSGLWHGANWHFVLWGVLQGIYIVIGDFLRPIKQFFADKWKLRIDTTGVRVVQTMVTFLLTVISFVFFRAETIKDGFYYIKRMITMFDPWSLHGGEIFVNQGLDAKELHVLLVAALLMIVVDLYYQFKKAYFDIMIKSQCLAIQYVAVIAMLMMILVFGIYGEGYDSTQFIYFQF